MCHISKPPPHPYVSLNTVNPEPDEFVSCLTDVRQTCSVLGSRVVEAVEEVVVEDVQVPEELEGGLILVSRPIGGLK